MVSFVIGGAMYWTALGVAPKALGIQSKKSPSIGAQSGVPSSSGGFAKFSS